MTAFSFRAEAKDAGVRLDKYLSERPELPSRSYLQRLIEEGKVLVDKKPVKSNYRLQEGNEIAISVPEPKELSVEAEQMDLNIVYEDDDLLVVNKPKGLVVHPAPGHMDHTLVNGLMDHCDDLSGINGILRPGIVHRIDKDTSGLLVVAKNDQAHMALSQQLTDKTCHREYVAIVHHPFDHS